VGIRFDKNQRQQGADHQLKLAMVLLHVIIRIFIIKRACAHFTLSILFSAVRSKCFVVTR